MVHFFGENERMSNGISKIVNNKSKIFLRGVTGYFLLLTFIILFEMILLKTGITQNISIGMEEVVLALAGFIAGIFHSAFTIIRGY